MWSTHGQLGVRIHLVWKKRVIWLHTRVLLPIPMFWYVIALLDYLFQRFPKLPNYSASVMPGPQPCVRPWVLRHMPLNGLYLGCMFRCVRPYDTR